MHVSEARLLANRANAQKSTGPRTEEGKAKSRANALKHGLCASALVPEDIDLIRRRSGDFFDTLKPQNELHVYYVDQVALTSVRIERGERIERRIRDRNALRAELTWDDDRRLDAEALGRKLAANPAEVALALRKTPAGCDWLMSRWALLSHAAVARGAWTEDQAKLAFDLLGTPHLFREGNRPGIVIDLRGQVLDEGTDPVAVARREVESLTEHRELVADLDEVNRVLASSDLTNEGDPELRRLRRYEATLHNRMRNALKEIRTQSPYRQPEPSLRRVWSMTLEDPEPETRPESEAEPELKPEPLSPDEKAAQGWKPERISPPFDLTPDEFPAKGEKIDLPKILAGRKEKRFMQAEARREAKRRKIDKLRAS